VTDSGSPFGAVEQDLFAGLPTGLPDAG